MVEGDGHKTDLVDDVEGGSLVGNTVLKVGLYQSPCLCLQGSLCQSLFLLAYLLGVYGKPPGQS